MSNIIFVSHIQHKIFEKRRCEMKQLSKKEFFVKKDRIIIGFLGLLLCLFIVNRSDFSHISNEEQFIIERGRVVDIHFENMQPDLYIPTLNVGSQVVEIELLSGKFKGETVQVENVLTRFHNFQLTEGSNVSVSIWAHATTLDPYDISIYGPSRGPVIILTLIVLGIGMVIVGRSKGVYALISLGLTFTVIIFYLVNGIVSGGSPVVLSIITSLIIISFTTSMISGASKETLAAISGALVGLISAGIASVVLGRLIQITGINLESVRHVLYHSPPNTVIRIQELFFAVVIIAVTGAMIDSSISISSASFEIIANSPNKTWKELYKNNMYVARSVLGANINTLILAFAGTSLITVVLIVLFGFSNLRIMNMELVAIEIIKGSSATLGMLVGLPATAFFSARLATWSKKK